MAHELLLACAWKGTIVLAVACGFDAALRKSSAVARHMVWTAAFLALLLLPALSPAVPHWTAQAPALRAAAVSHPAPHAEQSPVSSPQPARRDWLLTIWMGGAALALARFGVGMARMWLLSHGARPMPIDVGAGGVAVLDAGPGAMPLAWGWMRPVILLPSEAREWPAARLRVTLLHELGHVDRGDCWTLAMSELALALYWFHPLAWWAAARMRRERERACDDRVLAAGVAASAYASDLLHVARGRRGVFVAPAMARASQLEARLHAILDPSVSRSPVNTKLVGACAVAALLALLPLSALQLAAQSAEAGLSGTVYDASGAAVPGATVAVLAGGEAQAQQVVSDAAGNYSFPNLPAGRYQVVASHRGFAMFIRQSVEVPSTLNVILSLGRISESITVSGKGVASTIPPAPRRIRVGGNVQAARLLDSPRPAYPPQAQAAGLHGTVLLQAVVTIEGGISGLSALSSPDPSLADAAMEAVRQWRYQPTLLNGQPVEVVTTISVNFRLDP